KVAPGGGAGLRERIAEGEDVAGAAEVVAALRGRVALRAGGAPSTVGRALARAHRRGARALPSPPARPLGRPPPPGAARAERAGAVAAGGRSAGGDRRAGARRVSERPEDAGADPPPGPRQGRHGGGRPPGELHRALPRGRAGSPAGARAAAGWARVGG